MPKNSSNHDARQRKSSKQQLRTQYGGGRYGNAPSAFSNFDRAAGTLAMKSDTKTKKKDSQSTNTTLVGSF